MAAQTMTIPTTLSGVIASPKAIAPMAIATGSSEDESTATKLLGNFSDAKARHAQGITLIIIPMSKP